MPEGKGGRSKGRAVTDGIGAEALEGVSGTSGVSLSSSQGTSSSSPLSAIGVSTGSPGDEGVTVVASPFEGTLVVGVCTGRAMLEISPGY
jgi:hypothetical protein